MRPLNNMFKNAGLIAAVAAAMMVVGGGSAVAGKLINGKSIKKGTVSSKQIKNRSILGGDIRKGTIQQSHLSSSAQARLKGQQGPQGVPGYGTMVTFQDNAQIMTTDTSWVVAAPAHEVVVPQGASKLIVTFNAECAVEDAGVTMRQAFVGVRINGDITGGQSRMCNNAASPSDPHYEVATVTRFIDVQPGTHTVQVDLGVNSGNATAYLQYRVLTVAVAS